MSVIRKVPLSFVRCGERGIALKRKNIKLHKSRLGLRLLVIIVAAFLIAMGSYWGLCHLGTTTKWGKEVVDRYLSDQIASEAIAQFQQFISDNGLESDSFTEISFWLSQDSNIGVTIGNDQNDNSPYSLEFADKRVSVYPYLQSSRYEALVSRLAFLVAMLLFLLIVTPYIKRILTDIAHLADEMEIIANGDLQHKIEITGSDELAGLAKNIEAMRVSFNDLIGREKEALTANHDLIASLSHDLRTPLTKAIGYLELLEQGKAPDAEAEEKYRSRAFQAVCQVRERSDALFQVFSLEQEAEPCTKTYAKNDFCALLCEMVEYLQSEGFICRLTCDDTEFQICIDENDLSRIFDNLTSNVLKYADQSMPIQISVDVPNENDVSFCVSNHVCERIPLTSSLHLGVPTIKRLIQKQGGRAMERQKQKIYSMILSFKQADK